MKKIKVVHIITKLELGGAQRNTIYTVENLDKQKFEVYLLCGEGGILDKEVPRIINQGVKTYFVKNLVREINPVKDIMCFFELLKILIKINPHIVHTHSSKAGIVGRWSCFILKIFGICSKVKIIHTFHGFAFSNFHNIFSKFLYIFLEYLTAYISDILIFVSYDNIKTARKYKIGKSSKYLLIRSGIKISDFYDISSNLIIKTRKLKELKIKENEKIITTIGAFKPQKNLIDYIRLTKILTEENFSNLRFLLIGDGEQREFLINYARALAVLDKIIFLSWYKDIRGIMSISDIFVMTSLWEGLPRAAVEALVAGVPVVAYATDGLKDIIKDGVNGYLVKPKDLNALITKVKLLLTDEKLFSKIKNCTSKTIDKSFDIDYMVKQQEELYLRLLWKRNIK
ncbi:MAG: glycosyltransferase [Endomicrobia bacterium]|nr:glycosyltransferase [Endomicrobiia bacterium]